MVCRFLKLFLHPHLYHPTLSLEKALNQPIFLANDANAAACAEKIFGTAKNSSDFVYVTVSTGIGGGIFCNNRLVEGAGFSAGEVGHICIAPEGRLCV